MTRAEGEGRDCPERAHRRLACDWEKDGRGGGGGGGGKRRVARARRGRPSPFPLSLLASTGTRAARAKKKAASGRAAWGAVLTALSGPVCVTAGVELLAAWWGAQPQ